MPAPTQLSLYNGALRILGERKLASLSENREPRRLLDDVWGGAVDACLEEADWKFAQRTAKLTYNSSFTAPFGYQYQMDRPPEFVRWSRVCLDEFFTKPLTDYSEEAGKLYTSVPDIFVSYVSNGAGYGGDMSLWPQSFIAVVEEYLALQIIYRIEQSKVTEADLRKTHKTTLTNARSKDALQGPTKFLPEGSWAAARGGRGGERG